MTDTSVESVTVVDLMRHGEPEGGRRFRGAIDDPLSAKGLAQMRARVGDHCPWGRVVTSPLQRCSAFARELATRHGLGLAEDQDLREESFGRWDGRAVDEVAASEPEALAAFWRDPAGHFPPGGEPLAAFRQRILTAWGRLLDRHGGEHLLLVVHGGVIRVLLAHVLGMPLAHLWRIEVPYAALTRLRVFGHGPDARPVLAFHNGDLPPPVP
ncbi:MAG: histidine phosphatase family protein [Candidatus Competibacterales bacterium]